MYCKNCGKRIDDDSKFCSFCGTKQSFKNYIEKNLESNINILEQEKINNLDIKVQENIDVVYDNYNREIKATIVGIILILTNILFFTLNLRIDENVLSFIVFLSLIIRILITIWVVNIAKNQNRDLTSWGFLGFFFPSIALIIIGLLKKLKINVSTNLIVNELNNQIEEKINNENEINKTEIKDMNLKPGYIKVKQHETNYILVYSKKEWENLKKEKFDRFHDIIYDRTNEHKID